jgi:predicted O-methyltransferase YrrM
MALRSQWFDGKKYMWDGQEYEDKKKAREVEKEYREKGFDVQSCSEDGKILLFTRRVVTEVVVE